jgi:drug/metabolite transporter (DMT)-like permease
MRRWAMRGRRARIASETRPGGQAVVPIGAKLHCPAGRMVARIRTANRIRDWASFGCAVDAGLVWFPKFGSQPAAEPPCHLLPPCPAMAHVAFCFCCLVWGSMFILLERVTHVLGPVEIALWRFGGGAAVLAVIWRFVQPDYRPGWREGVVIGLVGLAFCAPPQIILPYLIGQGFGHSFFGQMVALVPLITILVSIPLLGVLPTQRQLVGVLGGLACMWLIVDDGFERGMSIGFLALTLWIPISSALSNTVIKWKLSQVPAVPLTATMLAVSGLWLAPLPFSPATMGALHLSSAASAPMASPSFVTWVQLFVLTVVATGFSTAAFVWMILKRGPLFAGMTTYVVPVLALLWGQVDRERISPQQLAAIVGVLAMVALVQSGSRRVSVMAEPAAPPTMLPGCIAEAIAPMPAAGEPHLTVASAGLVAADLVESQPESQVA